MKKEWFFDRYCGQQFAALVENGRLAEFWSEKESQGEIVGNVYKGKVTNVLSGMNAAFISCGLAKNCYLSMEETYTDYTKYDGTPVQTNAKPLELKVGDEIIVQVTKPSRGNKGAKVTTHLSFVGKNLIYLPETDFLGISRKIVDEKERERLLKTVDKLRGARPEDGFIVRTQASLASLKQLKNEATYLKKLYNKTLAVAESAPVGAVLYKDEELPVRMMRDSFGDELIAIHVGDEELYQKLLALVKLRGDVPAKKIIKHNGERSMLQENEIMPLVYDAALPIVPLKNGGYLVIEHTEAMTVVDVNTGSFIGNSSLEDTVFHVNLEAAEEIARQVRLRNVGGIVVVDFIDMVDEDHRKAVTGKLRETLALDRAKCNVLEMSEFCITQFTRKRVGNDVMSYLVKPCPHCKGKGHVPDDVFVITRLREAILDCFAQGYPVAIVDVNEQIMNKILEEGFFTIEVNNRWKDKRIYLIPHRTYKEEYFSVHGEHSEENIPEKAQLIY